MSSYAGTHAKALAKIQAAGAAVTFTKTTGSTYTPSTDTLVATTATVAGYAIEVSGDPVQYAALKLTEQQPATLLFAPSTYGEQPLLGSVATWGGVERTVRALDPTAPDGTWIVGHVVLG